jgi:GAF domain-containing protein
LDEAQTRADWAYDQEHGLNSFDAYLSRLEQDNLPPMPISENVQKLRMPVEQTQSDLFSQIVLSGRPRLITQKELSLLPDNFADAFEPALPFIIVPLLARYQVIGLLMADNKFTQSPITSEDIEALMTFANTAALAIDNAQLLQQIEIDRDRLRSFYAGSNTLISSQEPGKVLNAIVENARQAAKATWVTLALIDEDRQAQSLVVTDKSKPYDIGRIFRPDGLSMQVMYSGEPIIIEDANRERKRVNPSMFQNDIAAAVCLPLSLQGKQIGVMWVHYDQPRYFTEAEIEALQLYVDQAALAFDSARRIQALEQMRQTAQVVAQVTTLGNLPKTLDSVVSGIAKVVGSDVVVLYVYDQEKDWLDYPPTMFGVLYPEKAKRFEGIERDSIVFQMLRQNKLYIAEDVSADPYFQHTRFAQDEQIKSCVAIPLRVGSEKVGVMFVNFRQRHPFTDDELQNIELFAYQAAIGIRNAQLYKRSEERATRLMTLYEAGRAMTGSLKLQTIFERMVEQAPQVTKPGQEVSRACIRIIEGDQSRVVAIYPPTRQAYIEQIKGGVVNLKTGRDGRIGIMGRVAITGHPQLVGNVKDDPDYLNCNSSTRSEIAVPICLNDRVFAVISVEHEDTNAFDKDDLRALELLAAQAAVAIQNIRHAELLGIAAQVAREATASLEINELLNETVRLISERFGFYHVGALLLDEQREYAVLHAYYPQTVQERYGLGNQLKVGEDGIVGRVTQTGKYHLALDVHDDPYYLSNPDLPKTQAEMVVPLIARSQVIGALDMQSDKPIQLSDNDIATIQTMADQLANAIRSAQLLQEVTEHFAETSALQEVAVALTGAANPAEVFAIVVKRAMALTATEESSILFWDTQAEKFSSALRTEPDGQVRSYQTRARNQGGRARRIIDRRRPIAIVDARQEPDFNPAFIEQGYRASLGVPLLIDEQAFGVLYVRSNKPRLFSQRQIRLLEAFAGQAAVAIKRAQHYEEMRQIKGYVGVHTAVDWMRMVGTAWGHSLHREVGTALGRLKLLRSLLPQGLPSETETELAHLETLIAALIELPITVPLTYEDAIDSVPVNELVKTHVDRLRQHARYRPIKVHYQLQKNLDQQATVRASREWLRRGLELIVDNAVRAIEKADSVRKQVTVITHLANNNITILIRDSGPGIPLDVQEKLFKEPIPKPEGSRGSGIGLMLAQTIFQTYRGDIQVATTGPGGTTIAIILPIETRVRRK